MPSPNKLRIIYQNLVDLSATTITASSSQSASTSVSNLKKDTKGLVWRSSPTTVAGTTVKANLIVDLGSAKAVGGVVLAFTNLNSSSATIRIRGYTTAPSFGGDVNNPTITVGSGINGYDTGNVSCCPWNTLNLADWISTPTGSGNYSYGGGTYARVWLPTLKTTTVRYLSIEITDNYSTSASGRFIEVSRLIIGDYWSPIYNTGYGIEAGILDLSEHIRTESGDLLTRRGPRFGKLSFDLQWLADNDRKEITKIFLGNGMPKPLFVSLFPDSTGTDSDFQREGIHQLWAKMAQVPGVTYTNYEIYSTRMELEEV